MRHGFPFAQSGQTIGLLGGSFDPAHNGHVHITKEALKRFGLSRVWWLVSPGNPLKQNQPVAMSKRMARARRLMRHPKVIVSDVEMRLQTRYTAQTLMKLKAFYPGVHFVWLMGADNLAQFHRWNDWEWIMANVPIGVIARPGSRLPARKSLAAHRFRQYAISSHSSHSLASAKTPAWCFLNIPLSHTSSTRLRASGQWPS